MPDLTTRWPLALRVSIAGLIFVTVTVVQWSVLCFLAILNDLGDEPHATVGAFRVDSFLLLGSPQLMMAGLALAWFQRRVSPTWAVPLVGGTGVWIVCVLILAFAKVSVLAGIPH